MLNKEEAESILKKYNQEHLLEFYDELSEEEKKSLLEQINNIDFKLVQELYDLTKKEVDFSNQKLEPMEYIDESKLKNEEIEKYRKIGEEIIKNNQFAVVTMAGGQGTRLGHNGPKGTYDLGLESHKCIFELLCDNLKRAKEKYGVSVPWYVMTSKENDEETKKFFEEKNYFNYGKENIKFFKQGELPMISEDGKILLSEKGKIKEAADGHGGVFEALYKNHMYEDMKKKNIKMIFISGVDNVLAKLVDPIFIGATIANNKESAGKSVVKAYAEEKVGVYCKKNNRIGIIEYSEITPEMAAATDENGEFLYGESNILCNLFDIKVLERISVHKLPYHIAHKKANYIDENGNEVKAEKPNAYKFESFMFDAFEGLENMLLLRVKREEEFAPVKNKDGVDSPETARTLYNNYWKNNN